jgi:hypothetical protein
LLCLFTQKRANNTSTDTFVGLNLSFTQSTDAYTTNVRLPVLIPALPLLNSATAVLLCFDQSRGAQVAQSRFLSLSLCEELQIANCE